MKRSDSMGNAYLLTGEPKIGKTTALKKIIEIVGFDHFGGFYTEEIRINNARIGFRFVILGGKTVPFASIDFDSPIQVGKYGVDINKLEIEIIEAIYKAIETKKIVVIDEIGPMQLFSQKFKQTVINVLDGSQSLLGTIMFYPHEWADNLKKQDSVKLYKLSYENRNSIPLKIVEILKNETDCS